MADVTWQPIETAPQDGTEVLIYHAALGNLPGMISIGEWSASLQMWIERGGLILTDPTHWQPLPDIPQDGANG